MKKALIALLVLLFLGLVVHVTGAYTFFQERRVAEELPPMTQNDTEPSVAPQSPQTIKQGTFVDADFFHTGEGTAKIIEYPDGKHILRFEEFSVVNGPDVYVYLTRSTTPTGDIKSLEDYIDLGPLKGNVGDQNYELPKGAEEYTTVALWCKRFDVLFPYAILKTNTEVLSE